MSEDEYKLEKSKLIDSQDDSFTFRVNDYFLGISSYQSNKIDFYNIKNRNVNLNEYYSLVLNFSPLYFIYFQLNQKFYKILLVINNNNRQVELYELPEIFNQSDIELTPKFAYQEHSAEIHIALFNPKYSHIIASFSNDYFLHIWNIKRCYKNDKISLEKICANCKWEEKGNLLGFCQNNIIKIYDRIKKIIIYEFVNNNKSYGYEFLNEKYILILKEKKLKKINILEKIVEQEIDLTINFYSGKVRISKIEDYFIFFIRDTIYYYNYEFKLCKDIKLDQNIEEYKIIKKSEDINAPIEIIYSNDLELYLLKFGVILNEENMIDKINLNTNFGQYKKIKSKSSSLDLHFNKISGKREKNILKENEKKEKKIEHKEKIEDIKESKKEESNIAKLKIEEFNIAKLKIEDVKEKESIKENNNNHEDKEDSENNESIMIDEEDNPKENYFKGCFSNFSSNFQILNYENNEKDFSLNKKKKAYLEIDIVKEEFKKQSKSLIDLKNNVEAEIKKNIKFSDHNEEYLFYIKLLIKDDTNKKLLKKYLMFLKYIEEKNITLNYPNEKFETEINYYLPLLDKNDLKELNEVNLFKSQKEELIELLKKIKEHFENNTINDYKNSLEEKLFVYNQPFPLNSPECTYFECKLNINYTIKHFKSTILQNEEKNIKYIIDKILDNNLIDKIDSEEILVALASYIDDKEDNDIFDFFYNLINSKRLTEKELTEKIKNINDDYNNKYKFEIEDENNNYDLYQKNKSIKLLVIDKNLILDSPNNLCFENIILNNNINQYEKEYEICELYNYEYLKEHPPLNINIKNIKNFLEIVFQSKVFKELFSYLTGNQEYESIYNLNMIKYIIQNIKFLPLNYTKMSGFFDRLTFSTYIPTMKKTIFCKSKIIPKIIIETLENGVVVEIIFHEYGHTFSAILSYVGNSESLEDTPRKKNFNINEGGYYVEMALFGSILKTLTYYEALYILNIDNYNKTLEEFRAGFQSIKKEHLNIKGPFKYLENIQEREKYKNNISIRAKEPDTNSDYLESINATFQLKNDVKGRTFTEEEIMFYVKRSPNN